MVSSVPKHMMTMVDHTIKGPVANNASLRRERRFTSALHYNERSDQTSSYVKVLHFHDDRAARKRELDER